MMENAAPADDMAFAPEQPLSWQHGIFELHILSDTAIAMVCFVVAPLLLRFVHKQKAMPYRGIFLLFGGFIWLCGATNLMSLWVMWHPEYGTGTLVKVITAVTLAAAAASVIKLTLESGLEYSCTVVYDSSGNQNLQDQLSENEKLYCLLVDGLGDYAIYMLDMQGRVRSWSNSAERMKGYKAEEIIGQHFSVFYTPKEKEAGMPQEALRIAMESGVYNAETERVRKDGSRFWADMTLSALHNGSGEVIGFAKVTRDITERKGLEHQREQLIEKLTESNAELERFAYICSHDLQEPLRMVLHFTQSLKKHLGAKLDEKGQHYMKYISEGASHARQLIEDILSYARLDSTTELLATVDSRKVLGDVLCDLSTRIQETGARITHDALPTLRIQPTHLRQLLQNLISNALKFCQQAPVIHIGVEQDGEFWRFFVSDNGIGIAPEYVSKLFTIFQRLHTRERYPGTGIGLAVCKKVAQKYGGRIWVISEPNRGSTFYFTLPVAGSLQRSAA